MCFIKLGEIKSNLSISRVIELKFSKTTKKIEILYWTS